MRTYDGLGSPRGRSDGGDGNRTGVGREHRAVAADAVEIAEDLLLDLDLFEDGLDDDVGVGDGVEVGRRADPRQRGVAIVGADPALLYEAGRALADRVDTATQRFVGDVTQDHLPSRLCSDLRDTRSHEPGPDDGDSLRHCPVPSTRSQLWCVT